jgi:hypothetical protein
VDENKIDAIRIFDETIDAFLAGTVQCNRR